VSSPVRISVPDNFLSIRVRFLLNGWEVDIYSEPVYGKRGKVSRFRWNALIIHPDGMQDRHEIIDCEDYRAACWAAHQKTEELGPCKKQEPETHSEPSTSALGLT